MIDTMRIQTESRYLDAVNFVKTRFILERDPIARINAAASFVFATHLLGQLVPDMDISQVYEGTILESMSKDDRNQAVSVISEAARDPGEALEPQQTLAALALGEVEFDVDTVGFDSAVRRLLRDR